MALVTVAEVQSWLDEKKMLLPPNDPLEEEPHVSNIVLARLASVYDVSGWIDVATTPDLVRTIISGMVAALKYNKVYQESDEDAGNNFANRLWNSLDKMIDQIVNGAMSLTDSPDVSGNNPVFWPTDETGGREVFNALGVVIQSAGTQDIKFRVGQEW